MARLRARRAELVPHGSLRARLAGGTLWSLVAAAAGQGATLLAGLLAARILGAEAYGQYAIVIATTGMLGVFAGLGLGLTATRSIAELRGRDHARAARTLALLDRVVVTSGTLATVLMVAAAPVLASAVLGEPGITDLLRLGAPLLLLNEMAGVQTGVLAGFESFRDVARIAIVRGLLTVVVATLGAVVAGVPGVIVGTLIATGAAVLVGRVALRRVRDRESVGGSEGPILAELPVLWRFALPAFIASVLVGPVSWVGSALLVNQPDGFADLGVFNAANQWRTAVLFLPIVVGQASLPVMTSLVAGRRAAELGRVVAGAVALALVVALPIGTILVLGRNVIMALYGPDFADDGIVLAVVGITVIVMSAQLPVGQVLAASGRMWLGAATNIAWAVVFLIAAFALVPAEGALGLALAYLISYSAHTVWTLAAGWYAIGRVRSAATRPPIGALGPAGADGSVGPGSVSRAHAADGELEGPPR